MFNVGFVHLISLFFVLNCDGLIDKKFCKKSPQILASCRLSLIWNYNQNKFENVLEKLDNVQNQSVPIFKVVLTQLLPYIFLVDNTTTMGYVSDIFTVIQEKLEFKSEYKTMNYKDCLNEVENGKADIMLGAVVITGGYYNIQFTQPYTQNWYKIYFRKRRRQPSSLYYLGTLDKNVWRLSGVTVIVLSFFLWFTSKILNNKISKNTINNVSPASCLISVLSGYLNQGYDIKMKGISYRIQILTALLFGYVLGTAINAKLVAKIAVSYEYLPVQNLQQLKNQKTYFLCIRDNSYVLDIFTYKSGHEKIMLPQWKGVLNGPECLDMKNLLTTKELLCKNNVYVLENEILMGNLFKNYQVPCQVSQLPIKYFEAGNCFVTSKHLRNGFLHKITVLYLRIMEVGINSRSQRKWLNRKIPTYSSNKVNPVTMRHMHGIFTFFFSFIFLSLVILALEILISKYQHK